MFSGILTTPRHSPVSTMTLSATLVNRPKHPFQSPGTHQRGAVVPVAALLIPALPLQRGDDRCRLADPTENTALRLDHPEPHLLELREIRADAILEDETVEAAVIGF